MILLQAMIGFAMFIIVCLFVVLSFLLGIIVCLFKKKIGPWEKRRRLIIVYSSIILLVVALWTWLTYSIETATTVIN